MGLMVAGSLASAGGTIAGQQLKKALGDDGQQGVNVEDHFNMMNRSLNDYLQQGIGYSQDFTNQAIGQQTQSQQQAINALKNYNQAAIQGAGQGLDLAFNQSQALQSPYAALGYNAADAYADTLGLARPEMGSAALAEAKFKGASLQPLLQQLQQAGQAAGQGDIFGAGNAPTAPERLSRQAMIQNMSPEQQRLLGTQGDVRALAFQQAQGQAQGVLDRAMANTAAIGSSWTPQPGAVNKQAWEYMPEHRAALEAQYGQAAQALAAMQQKQQGQQSQFQNQQNLFNQFQQAQQNVQGQLGGFTPEQLQAVVASGGLFGGA